MPKLSRFEIEFDNPLSVYYAGTALSGRIVIVLKEPMEMRGVRVTFKGQSQARWSEQRKPFPFPSL